RKGTTAPMPTGKLLVILALCAAVPSVGCNSANHDERVNPSPDVFDPSRNRPRHVSLGAGIHFCVGAPLARLEMQIALTTLFEVLGPDLDVHPGAFRNTYHFRGLSELRLASPVISRFR
ncbi:MAG: cytochrome P450, partial [Pseudomonadota bacterium]